MPLEATQSGAPKQEKAFPNPETLDKDLQNSDDRTKPVNPRDEVMSSMDEKIDELRMQEMAESGYLPSDDTNADELEPGLQSQEQMNEPEPQEDKLPENLQNDPLADYIVMDGEAAMFRTKVDGEDRLIPLESAKAQLQKHVAADVRLQQVAKERKELEAREEAIRQNEAALSAKLSSQETSPPSEVTSDVSDQDLQREAQAVVKTLFTGSEDEAVESLTALLGKTSQARGPSVNPDEVVSQAVAAARAERAAEREREALEAKQKDLNTGFETFSEEYPEIVGDINLFRYADGMTDTIAEEHPDWAPSQVMHEAGVRTREWISTLKGEEKPADPTPNDRHNRKRNLKPMPQTRSAVQEREQEAPLETPASILEDMRNARGQG